MKGKEREPESLVTCSYFHCKMQHMFILAPSLMTPSCKFGMIKVVSLVEMYLCNASLQWYHLSIHWLLPELCGPLLILLFLFIRLRAFNGIWKLFYKSLFPTLCSSIYFIPGTLLLFLYLCKFISLNPQANKIYLCIIFVLNIIFCCI